MGMITISDQTLGELKKLAGNDLGSLEAQTEALLREALQRRQDRRQVAERLATIAAMTPRDRAQTDSLSLLREDRDR